MNLSAIEDQLRDLHGTLYNLVGLHRKLLDLVRAEKEVLLSADSKKIQEITHSKEVLLHSILQVERARQGVVEHLSIKMRVPKDELRIANLIKIIEPKYVKHAEKLHSIWQTLGILIQRIQEQNNENKKVVESSLEHVLEMKRNVINQVTPNSDVYSRKGKTMAAERKSQLLSKEI